MLLTSNYMSRFWQATAPKRRKTIAAAVSVSPATSFDVTTIEQITKSRRIVQKLNAFLVPQMVARHGFRWHNAHVNASLSNLVREAIFQTNVMHPGAYDAQRVKGQELKILTHLRRSNAHAFANHHRVVRNIVQKLFEDSHDDVINTVKERVFGVTHGFCIMHQKHHPAMEDMRREFGKPGEFLQFCLT